MSTAEIIAELPRLSAAELAEVEAKLRQLTEIHAVSSNTKSPSAIRSPKLANPLQAKDFVKQVWELRSDAKL